MNNDIEAVDGALLSTVVFESGSYATALENYAACKEWALKNGLCFANGLEGIIHSLELPGKSSGMVAGIIPAEQADEPGWVQKMTVGYLPDWRPRLLKIKLPAGAHWEGDLAK